jgi:hypothetical protein
MIKYPISNMDLLRSVVMHNRKACATVVFDDQVVQRMHADSLVGLCEFKIVREPEIKEIVQVCDLDGNCREYEQTRQQHHIEVQYLDLEDEFEVRLSITQK